MPRLFPWLLAFALVPGLARAQSTDNLLLVVNDAAPASVRIGEAYASRRALPADRVLHIRTATSDAIDRAQYERDIEAPIAAYLGKLSLQDRILYIVLTKGTPLRINGSLGLDGTMASVDSELTLLYRRMVGVTAPVDGRVSNPYFLADKPLTNAKPFTRFDADTYLVTRLDGFTVDDVLHVIDRSIEPAHN